MHFKKAFAVLAPSVVAVSLLVEPASAGVMMQGFYWDASASGTSWWNNLGSKANELKLAGFTAVWIPPVTKGASGGYSNGYDPFDDYDMGSKNQMGTVATRWGTREDLQKSVAMMRANGLDVYVDMVLNHRNGDDGSWNFKYADAYGVVGNGNGRFGKGYYDFHPGFKSQDANVPNDDSSFGRDLAHDSAYVADGLKKAGDWMTKSLDIQGYRLDYVKGISYTFLKDYLNYGAMAGKFAVGEYWDGNRDTLNWWTSSAMGNRSTVFDFALRDELASMANSGGYYDMSRLDHAGLTGINPSQSVTWVENHDTDGHNPISKNKHLAYAYILTSEGYPTVFYKDYYNYGMKSTIDNLIWIHEKIASGSTQQRWKDGDVFAYERMGGNHLLTALNDNGSSARTITVQTGFGANVKLHDYAGRGADVWTNGSGQATITIPANNYVAYSKDGIGGTFATANYAVTQEFAGASDLDIKPADNTQLVTVGRVYAQSGKPITANLYYDAASWTGSTYIYLELDGPTGTKITSNNFYTSTAQPGTITYTPTSTGWYTFKIRSYNTPTANQKPNYWLKTTYTAPQK
ncbi:alpha-amylase family glycosyl hydrolase [Tumebacillus sp. DT12]|uniref:Alpha-amylase n=1 Tax=Tumebacillus lacus TaxID=2995335 RepID=A0ABT3WVM3_9BACL|nr:alpha-amylase family glycosyl hydrolase [Tumebacillus lacus]MCX7568710.1 alpha-amylase family glycosyl hydrolase [Tumebacillus lacus]